MIGNDLIFGFGLTLALITGFLGIYVAKERGRSNWILRTKLRQAFRFHWFFLIFGETSTSLR